MLSALHLLQRKVGFVLGGVFPAENMSAAFLLLLSCLQDFFVFQALGFTFDLLDSSNYMINSLHPVTSSCCLGIGSDSSVGFWAVCKGSYGARGRFAKTEAAAKKYRTSNME